MATTLITARTEVRSLLNEPNAVLWTDSELNSWINEGCTNVARDAETKQARATFSAVVNQQKYTNTDGVPTDLYRVHRLEFAPSGSSNTYTLEFRGYMEMDQLWGINQQWPASYPLYFTIWSNPPDISIITYPVTSQTGEFNLYYYQQITAAASDGDNIDIIPGWEDTVYDYATYRALRKDGDPRWQDFKNDYETKLQALFDRSRDYQDQGNFISTGQVALPAWLINDDMGW